MRKVTGAFKHTTGKPSYSLLHKAKLC